MSATRSTVPRRLFFALVPLVLVLPAAAWSPPPVGQACKGLRGAGPEYAAVAGNYMGGRQLHAGMVDRKSFQACFRSAATCESWIARQAAAYPLGPTVATCARVVLR